MTIATIRSVLLDAERKQNDSEAVKNWMNRVKGALYDADDLFDEVATDDMLRQQIKGNKAMKKVRESLSRLNPIISNNSVAKKVKSVRKSLLEISEDMIMSDFAVCQDDKPISGMRRSGQDTGSFVDAKNVIGRDKDKEAILEMLLHESNDDQPDVQVIAIVGIGGMGKTTLTQLVYNHEAVEKNFEKRWFACISDTSDDKVVFEKIFRSIDEKYNDNFTVNTLQNKIIESIVGKKFLLVLDDVWDDDRVRWQKRMSLLRNGAKGSRIIVSTRSSLVARVVGALRPHNLSGLSEEDSWDLFKSVVKFTPEQEGDSTWTDLGREMVKKCANVPLAINCIASLLFEKNTIQEWESISKEQRPWQGHTHEDGIMPVLKLSYEHLPSNLKHCFAYCSLFPKDHVFHKDVLIYLWIAQGYISPSNENQVVEDVGHSYFMDLLRRSFFQGDKLWRYKMHDLIHDLAMHVAGEESLMLTTSSNINTGTRHLSVGYDVENPWTLLEPLYSVNRLRSILFPGGHSSFSRLVLETQFENLKSLRALSLKALKIENVPSCIGELKHLRYLDISVNVFKELPDSITNLVNLCTLNISECGHLGVLPNNFRELINLRHLCNTYSGLKHMPPGLEELTCLQRLDEFIVGNGMGGVQRSKLDVLSGLKLKGKLKICFEEDGADDDWNGVEFWQPPLTLQQFHIEKYGGRRIPNWGNGRAVNPSPLPLPNLTSLSLTSCPRVKCLPPFTHIPNIKRLWLNDMEELEYIEEEEEGGSDASFIPHLEGISLLDLPKLKGWWRKVEAGDPQLLSFPSLSSLYIHSCPELKSGLLCPRLQFMALPSVSWNQIQQLQLLPIMSDTRSCINKLEKLALVHCEELELWDKKKRNGVDY